MTIRIADSNDIKLFMQIRLEMLREVNTLPPDYIFSDEILKCSEEYFTSDKKQLKSSMVTSFGFIATVISQAVSGLDISAYFHTCTVSFDRRMGDLVGNTYRLVSGGLNRNTLHKKGLSEKCCKIIVFAY